MIEDNIMETPVFPNGCHICEIEIDPGSGAYDVVRYTTVDDVGLAINPLIVDGQTHGGIVQGAGEALGELCAMDPEIRTATGRLFYGLSHAESGRISVIRNGVERGPVAYESVGREGRGRRWHDACAGGFG